MKENKRALKRRFAAGSQSETPENPIGSRPRPLRHRSLKPISKRVSERAGE